MLDYYQTRKEQKKRKQKRMLLCLCAGVILLLIVIGGVWLLKSQWMQVREVVITGSNDATTHSSITQQVFDWAKPHNALMQWLCGERNSVSFILAHRSLERELAESHMLYKQIVVHTHLFKHQVEVQLIEKERYGVWCKKIPEAVCWLIDNNGIAFLRAQEAELQLYTVLVDDMTPDPLHENQPVLPEKQWAFFKDVVDFAQDCGLGVHNFVYSNKQYEEIELAHKPAMYFSLRFNPHFALQSVKDIVSQHKAKEYIDVSIKDRVFYK